MLTRSMAHLSRSPFIGLASALLLVAPPLGSAHAAAMSAAPATSTDSSEPAPTDSAPEADGQVEPAPVEPAPVGPAPVEPAPVDSAPTDSAEPTPVPNEGIDDPMLTDASASPQLAARPRHRWIYNFLLGSRYNPVGLSADFTTGYRYQLIDKDTALFRESFLAAQIHTVVTPAYSGIGPRIQIQPAAVLNLSASYDYIGFYGAFGSLQSFPSATDEWTEKRIDDLQEEGTNYGAGGHQVTLSALLQAKVKGVAIRDNLKGIYYDFDLRNGDRVFYNQTIDMMVPDRGWAITNDLDLLYVFDFGLTLGARYSLTHAFYRPEHFAPDEAATNPNSPTHRVGPAIIYTFFKRPDQRFDQPSLIVLAQWWAKHRYRTGQEISGAIPYFVLAFSFKGDLLPHPSTWNAKSERRKKKNRNKK